MSVTRRTLLTGASAVLGTGLLGISGTHIVSRQELRRWAARLGEIALARDLGTEYLHDRPEEASETALLARLDPVSRLAPWPWAARDSAIREHLRLDFADGDVVAIGGWRLGRTELRLCALAALAWAVPRGASGVFAPVLLADGTAVFWTSPQAQLTVTPSPAGWTLRLRSGAESGQTVEIRVDGAVVDERHIPPGGWHRLHFRSRPADGPMLSLELSTTPDWRPPGDFRTLGIGIDTLWDRA